MSPKGTFNNCVNKMRGARGQKMSVFVHTQGIKTVLTGGGGESKWQDSVHIVIKSCSKLALVLSWFTL